MNIFEAAATGRVARVRELLDKNPELVKAYSPDGWTALHLDFGNPEILKLTLDRGADIDAVSKNKFSATLQGAAAMQNLELARALNRSWWGSELPWRRGTEMAKFLRDRKATQ